MKRLASATDLRVGVTLLICGTLGGSHFILVKALVGQISPLQLVAARVALAALALALVLVVTKRRPALSREVLGGAVVLAILDAIIPYLLIAWAASHILASTSALLIATMPLFTAVFVSVTGRVRLPLTSLLGIALGACGVSILAGPRAFDLGSSAMVSILAVLAAAISYAAAAVYSRHILRLVDPIGLSAVKFAIASVVLIPAVALHEGLGGYSELGVKGWLSLLTIGIVVTGVARCGYVWVIGSAGSLAASLLTYIVPASALVLGWFFMNEAVTVSRSLAMALVGASLTCTLFGPAFVRGVRLQERLSWRPLHSPANRTT